MSKRLYPEPEAGQEIEIPWLTTDYLMACCDCHLVHRLRFTVRGKMIILQGWRENRSTAQLRRWHGVPIKTRRRIGRG